MAKEPTDQEQKDTVVFSSRSGTPTDSDTTKKNNILSRIFGSWEDYETTGSKILLAVAFSIVLGGALLPRFDSSVVIEDAKVGLIAPYDVRAPADMQVKDPDTTKLKREESASSVRPVYVYRAELAIETVQKIDRAFKQLRQDLVQWMVEHQVSLEETQPEKKGNKKAVGDEKEESSPPPTRETMANVLDQYMDTVFRNGELKSALDAEFSTFNLSFGRNLGVVLPDHEFAKLVRQGVPQRLQEELMRVVGKLMGYRLVTNLNLIETGKDDRVFVHIMDPHTGPAEYLQRLDRSFLEINQIHKNIWAFVAPPDGWSKKDREFLVSVALQLIQPNFTYDGQLTEAYRQRAREEVKSVVIPLKKGEVIVRNGEPLTLRHLLIFKTMEQELSFWTLGMVFLGKTFILLLCFVLLYRFGRKSISKFSYRTRDLMMMGSLLLGFTLLTRLVAYLGGIVEHSASWPEGFYYYLVPVAVAPAVVRIILNSETAILYTLLWTLIFSQMTNDPIIHSFYCLFAGIVGSHAFSKMKSRKTVFLSGFYVMLLGIGIVALSQLMQGEFNLRQMSSVLIAVVIGGLAMGPLILLIITIVESIFDYTTDLGLLELANLNHPLLKQLIVQAPGTYHHCIIVGSMVEAAAESIRANPLLARVGAFYHDVGKIKTPQYFGENLAGGRNNPHDKTSPNMSAKILQGHVKYGVELAKEHKLGRVITDLITQHHGTSLIQFFYVKAQKQAENDPKAQPLQEHDFRYPGPKPQTREAALIMLADSCEAASRSLQDASPERIKGLVQKIINKLFRDGQFDECDLTLRDLHNIARSFTHTLSGMHHHRPSYPDLKKESNPDNRETAAIQRPKTTENGTEDHKNGNAGAQSTKKDPTESTEVDLEDDSDLKRLGM